MRKQLVSLVTLMVAVSLLLPFATKAQQPADQSSTKRPEISKTKPELLQVDPENVSVDGVKPAALRGPAGDELITVMVELSDEPVLVAWHKARQGNTLAAAGAVARNQANTINAAQERLLPQINAIGGKVLYRVQRTLNGIAVTLPAKQVEELRKLEGVSAVRVMTPKRPANASGASLIGAPQLWDAVSGLDLRGEGMKIGIVDTGIDYIHTDFGGSGLEADYLANDTTAITETGGAAFPTAKVVGGWDFAGDAYDASSNDPAAYTPVPDPDPMDCNGHGTHVAGTAAGYGVNADGTTYEGPWDASSVPTETMRIGPGVAPLADLYALRVFGCDGSTNLVVAALEWATDPNGDFDFSDHLDVVNMSLGSDFGSGSELDPDIMATNNAALADVVVVASAGNSGDTFYITGAPAAADWAISVAASVDSTSVFDGFEVHDPASIAGLYPADLGILYDWSLGGVTGQVVYPPTQSSGCEDFDAANTDIISGNIVLLDWTDGECGSFARGTNAAEAGAIGMILADNSAVFDLSIFGSDVIPSISTDNGTGQTLKDAIANGDTVTATLSTDYPAAVKFVNEDQVDSLADFTSRGPRRGDTALKPDVAAPGVTIFSAATGTGNQGASFNGTSMAAPHVAGSMALLRQLHPDWSVEELKALVMNTAGAQTRVDGQTGAPYSPSRQGAGRVELANAGATDVVAYNADNPGLVSISFGAPQVVDSHTMVKNVRVVNKGDFDVTYDISVEEVVTSTGVLVSIIGGNSITVPAHSSRTFAVQLSVDANALDRELDSATDPAPLGVLRHFLNEHAGYVWLTPVATEFQSTLLGENEVPAVDTTMQGWGRFEYDPATNELSYTVDLESSEVFTVTAAHIHYGVKGQNGGVAYPLCGSGTCPAPGMTGTLEGIVTLSETDEALLYSGGLYVNVHTSANSGGEIRGQIVQQSALKVPFYAAPRPASDMRASGSLDFGTSSSASLPLVGTGVNTGQQSSLVWALELHERSVNDSWTSGIQDSGDLKYVGVGSDVSATGTLTDDTFIYFGVATYGPWSTPQAPYDVEFDIYIDTDRDGSSDFVIFNYNALQLLGGGDADDTLISVIYDLNASDVVDFWFINGLMASTDTAPYNSSVLVLPATAGNLGLTEGNSRFNYYVVTYQRETTGVSDISAIHTFDPAAPALDAGGGDAPVWLDLDGETIPVELNRGSWLIDQPLGLLLLHHFNVPAKQAEVVNVTVDGFERIYLPITVR
ncbi:MAG: hypothetical protein KatS3mg057_2526 [Herpetosiphonaceae bacterium]|nr:MAG: hypothetical protein KatS3mg057_2526 [Herpetosiphonaceae bacterium]